MPTDSTVALQGTKREKDSSRPAYPILCAARFELRPFAMRDIEPLTSMAREDRLADTTIGVPHPYTVQFACMWISSHEGDWQTRRALHWAASRRDDLHHLAGYAGLVSIDRERHQGELRFWVGRGVERRSDALEWSESAIEFAFNALHIERVYALQMLRHKLAAHVLESLGMRRVGAACKRVFPEGLMEDFECWAMQRAERRSSRTALAVDARSIKARFL
jgi:RimJ/RimL family protein N-acetyltransferase